MKIHTVGHSVHSKGFFIEMLHQVGIEVVADVRSFPGSNKFPQYNQKEFKRWLAEANIQYKYLPLLGGRRKKSDIIQEEVNNQWDNPSFHNYADYTLTTEFQTGIDELKQIAKSKKTVICCSERHPARCHRLLISNSFVAQGWDVFHIIEQRSKFYIDQHELGKWGALPILAKDRTVVYPEIDS